MDRRSFFTGAVAAIAICGVATPIDALAVPSFTYVWEEVPSNNPAVILLRVTVQYDD